MLNKGYLEPPRLTTAQRDALSLGSGETGVIFNSSTSLYEVWNGASWIQLSDGHVPSYIHTSLSSNRDDSAATHYQFDVSLAQRDGTEPLSISNGSVTGLKAGRIYELIAVIRLFPVATGFAQWEFVNLTASAGIGRTWYQDSLNQNTNNSNSHGHAIFIPTADATVGVRRAAGVAGRIQGSSTFTVKELL